MDKLMTLAEVAQFLRISKSYAAHSWPKWAEEWGVTPIRFGERGKLLFKQSEIYRMLEIMTVK
jgi:hypothetical protein